MANPFPFTAGQVLTAAQMNGIGEATAYTPTITNGVLGNGTITGSYVRVNKLVYGAIKFALGTTSTITGQLQFTFPVTNAASQSSVVVGNAYYYDNSSGLTYDAKTYRLSTTVMSFFATNASATYTTYSVLNATVPVAFGAGDEVVCSFTYEAA
jgi:hypothetical protein